MNIPRTERQALPKLVALIMGAAIVATSCAPEDKSATLIIEQMQTFPIGIVIQVALSNVPDFVGGYKVYSGTMTDVSGRLTFSGIPCFEGDGADGPRELWLLVANDQDSSATINDGDYILPAMRVVLYPGQTTVLGTINFDVTNGHVATADFSQSTRRFTIAIAGGAGINQSSPLILQLDSLTIPITDPMLASGMAINTNAGNGYAFIDANNNYTYDATEWRTHTSPGTLGEKNTWTLYTDNP